MCNYIIASLILVLFGLGPQGFAETYYSGCLKSYAILESNPTSAVDKSHKAIAKGIFEFTRQYVEEFNGENYSTLQESGYIIEVQAVVTQHSTGVGNPFTVLEGFIAEFYDEENGFGEEGDMRFYFYDQGAEFIGYEVIGMDPIFELFCEPSNLP